MSIDDPAPSSVSGAQAQRFRRGPLVAGIVALLVGAVLVGVAVVRRGDGEEADLAAVTTAATTPEGLGEGFAPERNGRSPLAGFGEAAATITSGDGTVCEVCLLAATTPAQRERGLMEVTDADLGGYDGMVFVYPSEVDGAFWMRNTPSPLSIAYFDDAGALVSTVDMAPCADSPDCPPYPPAGPFRFAVEVMQGRLPSIGVTGDATIRIDSFECPEAT